MDFEKITSEYGANKDWKNSIEEERQETMEQIKSAFANPQAFEEILSEFKEDNSFQEKEQQILEQIRDKVQNKKPPQQDDPFMDPEEWDKNLAESVKEVIQQNLDKSA